MADSLKLSWIDRGWESLLLEIRGMVEGYMQTLFPLYLSLHTSFILMQSKRWLDDAMWRRRDFFYTGADMQSRDQWKFYCVRGCMHTMSACKAMHGYGGDDLLQIGRSVVLEVSIHGLLVVFFYDESCGAKACYVLLSFPMMLITEV